MRIARSLPLPFLPRSRSTSLLIIVIVSSCCLERRRERGGARNGGEVGEVLFEAQEHMILCLPNGILNHILDSSLDGLFATSNN